MFGVDIKKWDSHTLTVGMQNRALAVETMRSHKTGISMNVQKWKPGIQSKPCTQVVRAAFF
jgi:hypothetical protein